ncbi:MAG: ATP-grasp domain-containing protein [Lachnospira sp.]|nr:ATP-grasp domain-containing protein [Lachnospira sp.]
MKKILLLGGSAQQVIAIETAKRLGYYTILCDYLIDNPGQYYADKFYLISTTDKEAIFKVALDESIDGVIAYASDPAAPTAAYVAEKMNLPTSPYKSVETLCNKDKFREFLYQNGFHAPQSGGYDNAVEANADIGRFHFPIIIKPVDSSGSKGATVLHSLDELEAALNYAFSFSRSHRIIVEEFIEKKHPYLIGGDIFVENGKIILWGLLNCHRDSNVNPLVPVGKSYPLELDAVDIDNVKATLQAMVDKLHMKSCGMNVELVVDKNGKVWPIDVGPRNGGNMIPDLLGMIFNVDVVEMAIKSAMGEIVEIESHRGIPFYATHNLHTAKNGKFEGVIYSEQIRPFIVRECLYKKPGEAVEYFDNAAKAIGIVFLKFDSHKKMQEILNAVNEHIKVTVQ